MTPISVLLHEMTERDLKSLPYGFEFLEYDTLYGTLRVLRKEIDAHNVGKRYVHLLYKYPPIGEMK
ncbi:MAG: hypothetical protein J6C93_07800 [Clostridia bacterium]|nr:hypothetical protein [Clostridia bacterium]